MKREEAENLVRTYLDIAGKSKAQQFQMHRDDLAALLALARLGLRVKWPSEEDLAIAGAAIDAAEWSEASFDEKSEKVVYPELARAALSALTEQQ